MKILMDENIPEGTGTFSPYGEVLAFPGRDLSPSDLKDADALIVRSVTRITEELISNSNLKWIGSCTIGTDHVDQAALKKNGIAFDWAPGCNCNAVGDYIISAIHHLFYRTGEDPWEKTLGIIGYGNVGRNLYKKAAALGMKVLAVDPPLADQGLFPGLLVNLAELQERADIISLHTPLTTEGPYPTYELVDEIFLQNRARQLTLINSSRGKVIKESAVLNAKKSGLLKFLALDVFPHEPEISPGLADACDLMTPHIAGYSQEGKIKGRDMILQAFQKHFGYPRELSSPEALRPPPTLRVNGGNSEEVFHRLLEEVFSLTEMDGKLRNALATPNPALEFDKLRKGVTERRDFASYSLLPSKPLNSELTAALKALGFHLTLAPLPQTEATT